MPPSAIRKRYLSCAGIALAVVVAFLALENGLVYRYFPHLSRFSQDFSATYLRMELRSLAAEPAGSQSIFLGDSYVWGWGVRDGQTAVALLDARGCRCRNLAFGLESPTNEYALVKYWQREGVRPRAVVLELAQGPFSPSNLMYDGLRNEVWDVAGGVLTSADRATLRPRTVTRRDRIDRLLGSVSAVYALHSDLRESLLLGEPPEPPRWRTFDQIYSLRPLDERNVSVTYLERVLDLLRASGTPVYAYLAPVNASALGAATNDPRFLANAAFLERVAQAHGAHVLRVRKYFKREDFYDTFHLNPQGHRKFAGLLADAIGGALALERKPELTALRTSR